MPQARGTVEGPRNRHRTVFYGLSTCIWCRRTRQFLEQQGVQFDYTYVDLLSGAERENVIAEVRKWNPKASFPTIVVDDARVVVGFRKEDLKKVIEI